MSGNRGMGRKIIPERQFVDIGDEVYENLSVNIVGGAIYNCDDTITLSNATFTKNAANGSR